MKPTKAMIDEVVAQAPPSVAAALADGSRVEITYRDAVMILEKRNVEAARDLVATRSPEERDRVLTSVEIALDESYDDMMSGQADGVQVEAFVQDMAMWHVLKHMLAN